MLKATLEHPDQKNSRISTSVYTMGDGYIASLGLRKKYIFVKDGESYKELIVEYKIDSGSIDVIPKMCNIPQETENGVLLYLEDAYGYCRV